MTNIPMPTEEQRRAALVLSAKARAERAELKRDMKLARSRLPKPWTTPARSASPSASSS